jgi:N-acetylglucosaminyldiphosphoundecaprenol N-acetyl-beta-D-mannosaminyltransferase
MKVSLLGISIDKVNLTESAQIIEGWIQSSKSNYVVTPNVEMIVAAQSDLEFRQVLNSAGLGIPDSARIGWGIYMQNQPNYLKRVVFWPFFLSPGLLPGEKFPVTTGTDLMENLIQLSQEKGYRIGLLGGRRNVAIKLYECLRAKYPGINIDFIQENLLVDENGDQTFFKFENLVGSRENKVISDAKEQDFYDNLKSRNLDILFVAFGHPKQEKWMSKNLHLTNVKVMIGVGGAFDYLSGQVHRAPIWTRKLGLEWLFRLILQPWRIIRFGSLIRYIYLILFSKPAIK